MILYKRGLPLVAQEDLGWELGLTVSKKDAWLFGKVRTSDTPPSAGWGTQIYKSEFSLDACFERLSIPLKTEFRLINTIASADELAKLLRKIENAGGDAIACFSYGKLYDTDSLGGHGSVFDRIFDTEVRLVDPWHGVPKLREVSLAKLYESMTYHTAKKSGGMWLLHPTG
ncbi:MAG TPA: hypothetical protein VGG13_02740 [Candidatus Saccharimonadales bacterium]|jgi:hypothetical protein